jgi:hypothetical protein
LGAGHGGGSRRRQTGMTLPGIGAVALFRDLRIAGG